VLALGAGSAVGGGCATSGLATESDLGPKTVARAQVGDPTPYETPAVEDPAKPDKGSFWDYWTWFKPPVAPPTTVDSYVLRVDGLMPEPPPKPDSPEAMLAGARELFRLGDFVRAEALYSYLADRKKTPSAIAEECRFYEAECLRLQRRLPKAADVYADLLNKFPNNPYREQALQHMFDIANFWLDDTRTEMEQAREKQEGKRWFITPHFIHFDREKPPLDSEGRAIEKLEQVRYNDMNGPLSDRALFLMGSVHFFNENFREADQCFTQIHEKHPNSPLAEQAIKLAIVSKNRCTGGPEYDGRKLAEARKLVQSAFDNYPNLANKERDFLTKQLIGINQQQADKDYKMAEFYKRTGHPGSAYFYFELVRRRYPNTPNAEKAVEQMAELRAKAEKKGLAMPTDPPPTETASATPKPPPGPEMAPPPRPLPELPQPLRPGAQ
jgi:outer membrane protein assembly factor BamD (BamD/ComL family)